LSFETAALLLRSPPSPFETLPRLSLRSAEVVPQDEGDHGYRRGSLLRASAITRGIASSFAGAIT
jgi:hypothetical protein